MRLFEAIVEANHRALAGDLTAGLHQAEFAESLPIVALTCIDPRLNPIFPDVLGVTKENFIQLRTAGNIVDGSTTGTARSLALACALKGAKEIAIIGHTDCAVRKTSAMNLTECFRALGIERGMLPDNLTEFFGLFASEPQNVMRGVEHIRQSSLIGPKIPVHGLMVDIVTGKLDWVVNGYEATTLAAVRNTEGATLSNGFNLAVNSLPDFKIGEMKFPETKIGDLASKVERTLHVPESKPAGAVPGPPPVIVKSPPVPPKVPMPVVPPGFKLPRNMKF
jgi:carbonic anhydrase